VLPDPRCLPGTDRGGIPIILIRAAADPHQARSAEAQIGRSGALPAAASATRIAAQIGYFAPSREIRPNAERDMESGVLQGLPNRRGK